MTQYIPSAVSASAPPAKGINIIGGKKIVIK